MANKKHTSPIVLSKRLRRPVRVRVSDRGSGRKQVFVVDKPFRVGYGSGCELHLAGPDGPETLFEFAPVEGPTRLSTPLDAQEIDRRVDLLVDGQRYHGQQQDLHPGTRIQVHDRLNEKRFDLVVDEPSFWLRNIRSLSILGLIAALAATIYGTYLFQRLGETNQRLKDTELRLTAAEAEARRTDEQLATIIEQVDARTLATRRALTEVRSASEKAQRALRDEFSLGLKRITEDSNRALASIAKNDAEALARLSEETDERVLRLRETVSEKLVHAFERLKLVEQRVLVQHASRIDALEVKPARFQRILAQATDAVLFVHTRYTIRNMLTGEDQPLESTGTAFLIGPAGLAVAPRHVFEPWLFDHDFLALQELGLISLVSSSPVRHVWLPHEQVIDTDTTPHRYLTDGAFNDQAKTQTLLVLHHPELKTSKKVVPAPLGVVEVESPLAGPSDLVVFQLMELKRAIDPLMLNTDEAVADPLDEILTVGYPLARLKDGRSVAQGVKGFVRRVGAGLLELDTPLQPGNSGGPVLNAQGLVIGMAIAILGSDSYAVAVPSTQIRVALEDARKRVLSLEQRLLGAGCQTGPVDGVLDLQTWQAMHAPGCRLTP